MPPMCDGDYAPRELVNFILGVRSSFLGDLWDIGPSGH
jgi:hypothetical protein